MKKVFLLLFTMLSATTISMSAQADSISMNDFADLQQKVESLELQQKNLWENIKCLKKAEVGIYKDIRVVNTKIDTAIVSVYTSIDEVATKTDMEIRAAQDSLVATQKVVSKNYNNQQEQHILIIIFGVIGLVIAIVLSIILYGVLTKRVGNNNNIISDIQNTQQQLQEESVRLDNKLVELFEKQLLIEQISSKEENVDHSLVKKIADEIIRMHINLSRMDSTIKGYKQLSKAIDRIKDNFLANGYEIVDMLGKPYNDGMKVIANFVSDETLEEGQQIITSITKPQINYKGVMIQAAEITVSQNI